MTSTPIDCFDNLNYNDNDENYEIYKFKFKREDLEEIYGEILQDVSIKSVMDAFSDYITANIEPIGWKAIWIPTANEIEHNRFVVEILNVYDTMDALILIKEQISNKNDNNNNEHNEKSSNNEIREYDERKVPLIELFVISNDDDDQLFYKTAYIIEIYRFFYLNLWRPWDNIDDQNNDQIFLENRFISRLNFAFDIKENLIEQKFINRYENILIEAQTIKESLDKLKSIIEENNDDENSEIINPLDFYRLITKLEKFSRSMSFIENPELRQLYDEFVGDEFDDDNQSRSQIVLHVVVKNENFRSISHAMMKLQNLLSEEDMKLPIKFHNSFEKALSNSKSNDRIYLSKGDHTQESSWIEKNLEIHGLEPSNSVFICSTKNCGDLFMFVNITNKLLISNITFKILHPIDQFIYLKSGHLILENCRIDYGESTIINDKSNELIKKMDNTKLDLINTTIIGH